MARKHLVCNEEGLYHTLEPVKPDVIVSAAVSILRADLKKPGDIFDKSSKAANFLYSNLASEKREVFAVMFLDAQNRMLAFEKMFMGTVNQSPVFPRVIAQRCLTLNAAAVILSHNHPSGEATPSRADEHITRQIKDVLDILDIRCLDHFVIGSDTTFSFAEKGLL